MKAQYDQWGVVIQTSQVRGVHIANGIVQLLRLFPDAPSWVAGEVEPADYEKAVTKALGSRFAPVEGDGTAASWKLSDAARALCVTTTKEGPLSLSVDAEGGPAFFKEGRRHLARFVDAGFDAASAAEASTVHTTLAAALNADGRVYASGGSDPTTPSLSFAGYTSTHTLKGMHAATFLGLLCKTPAGAAVVRELYDRLRRDDDPHAKLIRELQLDLTVAGNSDASFEGAYPIPTGPGWDALAARAARLATRLFAWSRGDEDGPGASKPDALMAVVDLASLVLFLQIVQWRPSGAGARPLLLMVSPSRRRPAEAIVRAQQSLLAACAAVDFEAEQAGLVIGDYYPSVHARNLGAAGGWLFPLDSRGAPKRWFCPGARQLQTLVHALVEPGEELAWPAFSARALDEFGLVIGGVAEANMAAALGLGGGANSIREAGRLNREHLVAVGLARQESDNVVLVDGGGQ
jgi:hypothetical protein